MARGKSVWEVSVALREKLYMSAESRFRAVPVIWAEIRLSAHFVREFDYRTWQNKFERQTGNLLRGRENQCQGAALFQVLRQWHWKIDVNGSLRDDTINVRVIGKIDFRITHTWVSEKRRIPSYRKDRGQHELANNSVGADAAEGVMGKTCTQVHAGIGQLNAMTNSTTPDAVLYLG